MLRFFVFALSALSIRPGKSFPVYDLEEDPDAPDYYRALDDRLDERNATVCEECVPELCPSTQGCRAGVVRDSCACCMECGNLEGQTCDPEDANGYYGRCGENLECSIMDHEPVCVCASQEPLCGSDGQTYMSRCKFKEAAFSKPGLKSTDGPCKTEASWCFALPGAFTCSQSLGSGPEVPQCDELPIIKVPPRDLVNVSGSSAVFLCEVFAFPMALVEWRKDGEDVVLPGDDPHISVQSRGGPQKYELSSWLQIEDTSRSDSGTYRCTARNGLGSVSATVVLGILPPDEMAAYLKESFNEQMGYDPMRFYDGDYY